MIWYWVCSEDKLQSDLFKARCKLANQKTSSTDKLVFAPVFQWLQLQENEKIMKTNKQQKQQQPAYPKLSSDFTARIYKSLLKPRHFELWKGSLMSCWCKRISNVFSFLFSSFFCRGWRAGGGAWAGRVSPSSASFFFAQAVSRLAGLAPPQSYESVYHLQCGNIWSCRK